MFRAGGRGAGRSCRCRRRPSPASSRMRGGRRRSRRRGCSRSRARPGRARGSRGRGGSRSTRRPGVEPRGGPGAAAARGAAMPAEDEGLAEAALGPVAADAGDRPAAAELGRDLAQHADRGDLGAGGHRALCEPAGADGLDDLVLAPADLDVEVDLHRVERRLGEGVEGFVERERLLGAARGSPVVSDQDGPAPSAGPAGAVRQSEPSAKSSGGRRTSNSIASTPASTAAWKLSIELPGTIPSAPLCPTRSMRGEYRLEARWGTSRKLRGDGSPR